VKLYRLVIQIAAWAAALRWNSSSWPVRKMLPACAGPTPINAIAATPAYNCFFVTIIPPTRLVHTKFDTQAAAAYFDLAHARRVTDEDQPMVEQMEALLGYGPLLGIARQLVHFGLGKAYDDLGQYEAAMRHFESGNRLVFSQRPFDWGQFGAGVNRLIATFTPEFFAAHAELGCPDETPLLVLGMPRSGTPVMTQPGVPGGQTIVPPLSAIDSGVPSRSSLSVTTYSEDSPPVPGSLKKLCVVSPLTAGMPNATPAAVVT